jgi:spermidine synthase
MVNVSREHIPEWSDCSDLVGSSDWCIEDPRATKFYQDALQWFTDRYGDDTSPSEQLDVIILDAL